MIDSQPISQTEGETYEKRHDYAGKQEMSPDQIALFDKFFKETPINGGCLLHSIDGVQSFLTSEPVMEVMFRKESHYELIDTFVQLFIDREKQKNEKAFKKYAVMSAVTLGWAAQVKEEEKKDKYVQESVQSALKSPPADYEIIFWPMHLLNHWALLVVHIVNEQIQIYDLMRALEHPNIQDYVRLLKKNLPLLGLDISPWPIISPEPCPQQGSGDDCGIFVCKYIESLSRREFDGMPFTQSSMDLIRCQIGMAIVQEYYEKKETSDRHSKNLE